MASNPPSIEAGFPHMWQPVHDRYRLYFKAADTLQRVVADMMQQPVEGGLWPRIAARMTLIAANTMGAVFTLVLNGYGHDAMKLARGLYETDINMQWLMRHPEEFQKFIDYNAIQQKQMYDELDEEQQQEVSKEEHEQMMEEYKDALPVPRYAWSSFSFTTRAKEAEKKWGAEAEAQGIQLEAKGSLYTNFTDMHALGITAILAG
jgi:hypothetical protein